MIRIILLLSLVWQVSGAFATAQTADVIYMEGEKWLLLGKPLYEDSLLYGDVMKSLPEKRYISTANWEGYTAYWEVIDGRLYLQKIEVMLPDEETGGYTSFFYSSEIWKNRYAAYIDDKGFFAGWYSGDLRIGRGEELRWASSGFLVNYSEECVLKLQQGVVKEKQVFHNYKRKGKTLSRDSEEIRERFPFDSFPELDGKRINVSISEIRILPDGHFLDANMRLYQLGGERMSIKEQTHPVIKALKEVMRNIYPWEVLYINGEYVLEWGNYTIVLKK